MSEQKENPFVKAETLPKRLKLLMYGPTGSGKTINALQFPSPVVIDMERGTELYGHDFDFHVVHATTFEEASDSVTWLMTNKHEYRTLIIDPITILWQALQAKWSDIFLNRNKTGKGFKFEFYEFQPRDWNTIKAEHNEFTRALMRLDMNVIITCHQKDLYAEGEFLKKIGLTYDGVKGLDYLFDVVLRLWRTSDGKFMGFADKDRRHILPVGEFPMDFKYFRDGLGETLVREAVPIQFASSEQIEDLETWFTTFQMDDRKIKAMLGRDGYEWTDELPSDYVADLCAKFKAKHEENMRKKGITNATGSI